MASTQQQREGSATPAPRAPDIDSFLSPYGPFRAFSLLLCTVGLGAVRLFLRKSRVGSGCFVYYPEVKMLYPPADLPR